MSQCSSRFDVTDPMVVTRLLCGLFYFPHSISKLLGFTASVGFFTRAGFYPPEFFVVLSITMELLCGICLTFGLFTKYAGVVSAGLMAVAGYAIVAIYGLGWFWGGHGVEYLVFWAIASLAVALNAWNQDPGIFGYFAWRLRPAKS